MEDWQQRAVDAEETLRDLIKYAEDFRYWVEHNPDCAADPCAENYNLSCSLKAAKEFVGLPANAR